MNGNRQQGRFVVIGENIHTTRVVLKTGPRFTAEGDEEAARFVSADGEERLPRIPGSAKVGQDYAKVRIKHGKFTPGMHIPVVPYEHFKLSYPDYVVLFAWNHLQEIMDKETAFTKIGGW